MMSARSCSDAARDDVGGGGPVAAHAHVERPILAEPEATLRRVELHRGNAEVEHDAIDTRVGHALFQNDLVERAETALDQNKAAVRRGDLRRAGRDGGRVTIDADDAGVRGRESAAA